VDVIGAGQRDAHTRKVRSEALLSAWGVPINPALPTLESETNTRLRPVAEIVSRVLALCYVALLGQPDNAFALDFLDQRYDIQPKLTANERVLATKHPLTQVERDDASWRYEAMGVLLWILGALRELPDPVDEIDARMLVALIKPHTESDLIASAKPRQLAHIVDAADVHYRCLWAVRDAHLHGRPSAGNLNPMVVSQRLYAFNWAIQYQNRPWDDVIIDT